MAIRELPAGEAARRLRVNGSRIRQLAAAGVLPGRKIADRWFIDAAALERRQLLHARRGRPLASANAWALLFLASGKEAPWIRDDVRSKLRRRLRERPLLRERPRVAGRAETHYFVGGEPAKAHLLGHPRFVRSGVSAAAEYGAAVRAPVVVEGYLPPGELDDLAYRFALEPVDEREADLIVHAVHGPWPFGSMAVAPKAVVAIDLADSLDQRTRRAGEQLLKGLSA